MEHSWTPQRLAIGSIQERAGLQMRHGPLAPLHVKALARAMVDGREVDPIKVARIGKALCVVDGFHRLEAARSVGLEAVEALVARMDLKQAEAFARVANVAHGRNLTRRDKAKAWGSYVAAGGHLDGFGGLKSSRAISGELAGMYSHTTVRAKLKASGIEPNDDLDAAEGSKWSGRWSSEDDGGDDIDDFDEGAEGPLDADGAAEALGHLEAIAPIYFALGERHRLATLGAVRDLLGRLEANVAPGVPEGPRLDI